MEGKKLLKFEGEKLFFFFLRLEPFLGDFALAAGTMTRKYGERKKMN